MTPNSKKWSREEVLTEARHRVASMIDPNPDRIKTLLESLVDEAGWKGEDLLNALCKDVVRRSTRPPPRLSGSLPRVFVPPQKSVANDRRK